MNNKLKICHLTPTYFSRNSIMGGGERYVYNLVRAVNFAAQKDNIPIRQAVISVSDRYESFECDGVKVTLLQNISPVHGNMNFIPDKLRENLAQYDLVHLHQSLTIFGEYAAAVVSSMGIPFVATDHGGGNSPSMLFGKGLELADSILSVSNYAKSLIQSSYSGWHNVLIGPVDTDFFKPNDCYKKERGKFGICVSRIMPHKGIDRIISALPGALPLKIVGTVYDENYFGLLKELAKDKNVEFIHDADDEALLNLYRDAGIFLQGSTHKDIYGNTIQKPELMGFTPLEAMSCGLPVIISDAGSFPELVSDNRFGFIFSTHEELSNKLLEYINLSWPEDEIANNLARRHVVDNYSFLRVGRALISIYEAVTQKASVRSLIAA